LVERHAYTVNVISSNLVPPTKSLKCYGSITASKAAGRGSTPWRDAKNKLRLGGRAAQCNGLQIRKTVSSNLTLTSNT
jgi:hypothetical protein